MNANRKYLVVAALLTALGLPAPLSAAESDGASRAHLNRAELARPRTVEEHPELVRPAPSVQELRASALGRRQLLLQVSANRAVAARPRTLEAYPELAQMVASGQGVLARHSGQPLELAPLK